MARGRRYNLKRGARFGFFDKFWKKTQFVCAKYPRFGILLLLLGLGIGTMLKIRRPNAPEHETDEALLIEYVRNASLRHLGLLFERYIPMVYGVCLKILKDTGKAEDAVMGIYEDVARKAKDHEIGAFRGWLYVLARNYCLMEWRKAQRQPTHFFAPEDMQRYDATEDAFEFELPQNTAPLQDCLDALPERQLRSVMMFYYEEKSYKDIAETLAENVGSVRSYIQNGRRNLKNCLEG
jgi:RNA polymerase sigma factor (sigma-70 family)